ncbi:histidine phosphatase superfamily, partial [Pyrenochaeta sp. MPI-SDFR-AT-0127]
GELTDHGRNSMVQLGRDLREQYITGLSLLPSMLSNPSYVYFRSSPFPRALESLQHVIWGMFPPESRTPDFGSVNIVQRGERDETLLPNEDYCVRFIQIFKAYTERASNRWNNSDEMKYINALIGKYVPQGLITVAGAPKIHAIYDIITSTLATDNIRLPEAFYDEKLGDIVDRLAYNEEFGSYGENKEMRTVGIGAMLADVVERVVSKVEHEAISASQACSTNDDYTESTGVESNGTKLWLYGSHDSTLGAVMAGLGADEVIEGECRWPPYGSVLAVEVFRDMKDEGIISQPTSSVPGFLSDMRHHPISRTPTRRLSQAQKARLRNYYIRLRYNNRSLTIPGCKLAGKNWNEDATFCTLEAFKEIVDHFTPSNWRRECGQNLSK